MGSFTSRRAEFKKAMEDATVTKDEAKKMMTNTNYKQARITLDYPNDIYVTKIAALCGITKTSTVNHLLDHVRLDDIEGASKHFAIITGKKLAKD